MSQYRNPELARLLANLNSYNIPSSSTGSPQGGIEQTASPAQQYAPVSQYSTSNFSIPGLGFLPPEVEMASQINVAARNENRETTPVITTPKVDVEAKVAAATPPIPDASTITTWAAAVKHVTKHIATNDKVVDKIKRMVAEQVKHEQDWFDARQAIVERHQGRPGTQQKVADLLKSLGGFSRPSTPADPKADEKELADYDKKVHRAMEQMVAHFDSQLAQMGIPFYAIKHQLVVSDHGKEKHGSKNGKVDKGELRELQKRMLQHLEDLFIEEGA